MMAVPTATWHQYCHCFFMCSIVGATLKEKRERWTKKDKEEKIVVGTIKKKEIGFQDPCLIPIFV